MFVRHRPRPRRDIYNVRKVDTHVHHSAWMNQTHLLRFTKSKMKNSPDEVVLFRDGRYLVLEEVLESVNLTACALLLDHLTFRQIGEEQGLAFASAASLVLLVDRAKGYPLATLSPLTFVFGIESGISNDGD